MNKLIRYKNLIGTDCNKVIWGLGFRDERHDFREER